MTVTAASRANRKVHTARCVLEQHQQGKQTSGVLLAWARAVLSTHNPRACAFDQQGEKQS